MKYFIISIKDLAVQAFQPVHSVRAEGEAMRNFMDIINNPESRQLHTHPEDFDLYHIGYFDDETGELDRLEQPRLILRGQQAKITKP